MNTTTYKDFNKFLDENDIDVGYAQEGDDILHKMLEVLAFQSKQIKGHTHSRADIGRPR